MWNLIAEAEKVAARMGLSVLNPDEVVAFGEPRDVWVHSPIPEGSMRVGPGTDAVVWRTCPTHKAQA